MKIMKKAKSLMWHNPYILSCLFFSCRNMIYYKEIQKDIQRYVYCTDNNVPPYEGGYDKQPALWVDRYFTIKKALANKEKASIEKTKKDK